MVWLSDRKLGFILRFRYVHAGMGVVQPQGADGTTTTLTCGFWSRDQMPLLAHDQLVLTCGIRKSPSGLSMPGETQRDSEVGGAHGLGHSHGMGRVRKWQPWPSVTETISPWPGVLSSRKRKPEATVHCRAGGPSRQRDVRPQLLLSLALKLSGWSWHLV